MISQSTQRAIIPRSLVAGFSATMASTFLLFISHLLVMLLSKTHPGSLFARMADNPLVNGASANLYFAVLVNFVVGVSLAVIYAKYWHPHALGSEIKKGLTFSIIPWLISVAIFFPITGVGLFGTALKAGAIPALGSLFLHLAYGAVLGISYGPAGDYIAGSPQHINANDRRRIANRATRGGALGLLIGTTLACCFVVFGTAFFGLPALQIAGMPVSWFFLASFVFSCSMGLLVGLWVGAPRRFG